MAKQKIILAYNSTKAESLVSAVLVMGYHKHDTIEAINTVAVADIDPAIAARNYEALISGLTASQDILYIALDVGDGATDDITSAQKRALQAKLVAGTGVTKHWVTKDRTSNVSMCFQAWKEFNHANVTPPYAITYMSDKTANLTDAEQDMGNYLELSIPAVYNKIGDANAISFTDYHGLAEILDKGLFGDDVNTAKVSNVPKPFQNMLKLHDLIMQGEAISKYNVLDAILNPVI